VIGVLVKAYRQAKAERANTTPEAKAHPIADQVLLLLAGVVLAAISVGLIYVWQERYLLPGGRVAFYILLFLSAAGLVWLGNTALPGVRAGRNKR